MSSEHRIRLAFWGVRGSTPTPQYENLRYGGNTACLELRTRDNGIFILDAGTGIRNLGRSLRDEFAGSDLEAQVFLTHFHWDHIQGIPFFAPLYDSGNSITFHAMGTAGGIEAMLKGQMQRPYFPVGLEFMSASKKFDVVDRDPLVFGDLTLFPFPLNHPQGARGFRVECGGAIIVYASDLEHGDPELDSVLREQARDADILIFDSQFTPERYETHRGWGHSTWVEATRVARDSGVKKLILFHHDPSHDDSTFDMIVADARREFENTDGAKEGSIYTL